MIFDVCVNDFLVKKDARQEMEVMEFQKNSDRQVGGSQNGDFWPYVPTSFVDAQRDNLNNSNTYVGLQA